VLLDKYVGRVPIRHNDGPWGLARLRGSDAGLAEGAPQDGQVEIKRDG